MARRRRGGGRGGGCRFLALKPRRPRGFPLSCLSPRDLSLPRPTCSMTVASTLPFSSDSWQYITRKLVPPISSA
jgi:hypothetical protein